MLSTGIVEINKSKPLPSLSLQCVYKYSDVMNKVGI